MDAAGNVFGECIYAGFNNTGMAFEIVGGSTVKSIATLPAGGESSGYLVDPTGVLYGTQQSGGAAAAGDVYQLIPPTHLAFTQQPTTATVATTLPQAVRVTVESTAGATVSSSVAVALSIASGPTGGKLAGTATVNASGGMATFSNLSFTVAGTYVLTASTGGVLSGSSTGITVAAAIAPAGGSIAGVVAGSSAGETIYLDANNNGKLDATEASTTTLANGSYAFTGVAAGAYVIRQILPAGITQTSPANGYGLHVTVTNNSSTTNQNFTDTGGTTPMPTGSSVAGTVAGGLAGETIYLDANNNSKLDTAESSTTTLADGSYTFTGVAAGAYVIRQVLPTGYTQTSPSNGYGIHVTVAATSTITGQNFTDAGGSTTPVPPTNTAALSGFAFNDINKNGVFDGSDGKTSGKTIFLDTNNDGLLDNGERSVVTAADGSFIFGNLAAGTYHVRRVFPSGYTYSTAAIDLTLAAGQSVTGLAVGSKSV